MAPLLTTLFSILTIFGCGTELTSETQGILNRKESLEVFLFEIARDGSSLMGVRMDKGKAQRWELAKSVIIRDLDGVERVSLPPGSIVKLSYPKGKPDAGIREVREISRADNGVTEGYLEYVSRDFFMVDGKRIFTDRMPRSVKNMAANSTTDSLFGARIAANARFDGEKYQLKSQTPQLYWHKWRDHDRKLSVMAFAAVKKEYANKIHPNRNLQIYISRICQRLKHFSQFHGLNNKAIIKRDQLSQIRCGVLKGDAVNAFAVPDGTIFIFEGMLKKVIANEAQLAAVLGHEMAHVSQRHTAKQFQKNRFVAGVLMALDLMHAGSLAAEFLTAFARVGIQSIASNSFSRSDEAQADRVGLGYATLAGYDPLEAAQLWHRMHRFAGPRNKVKNAFLGSHPTSDSRFESIYHSISQNYRSMYFCDPAQKGCARFVGKESYKRNALANL